MSREPASLCHKWLATTRYKYVFTLSIYLYIYHMYDILQVYRMWYLTHTHTHINYILLYIIVIKYDIHLIQIINLFKNTKIFYMTCLQEKYMRLCLWYIFSYNLIKKIIDAMRCFKNYNQTKLLQINSYLLI